MRTRRRLLGALGAGIAAPRLLFAQPPKKVMNVAVLFVGDSEDDEQSARPFFEAMARFGWVEGANIAYERHSGRGTRAYLETMVSNAAGSAPDLIVATTGGLAAAVLKESEALPMVFITMSDPVSGGLVGSLARPGRNATGVYQIPGNANARRYALIRQTMHALKRVAVVFDRAVPELEARRASHEKAARASGFAISSYEFTNFEAVAKILAQAKRDGIAAAVMTPSFALTGRRREVVSLAERNGIAVFAHRAEWADAGAVLSYGVDVGEGYRRAAALANRVLKSGRAASIAVDLPNRFELVVNPRAAHALGIALPKALLQQASRVIA